jgi:hypothetical protein
MNPEKYSEHTALNHSLLWRKSYSFEKPDLDVKPSCHKQTNQRTYHHNLVAQSGVSWRTRNNMIRTNFSGLQSQNGSFKKSYSMSRVSKVLENNHSESPETKNLKQSLIIESGVLERSGKLIEGMEKLREMKLLSNKDLQRVKFPGVIRHAHVHNDYHERVTNPGFSRNVAGKHFTK